MSKGKQKPTNKKSVEMHLAVAWYKPTQWLRLKEISEDGDQLEETYGEWQLVAEKALKDFAAAGVIPEKVEVDVKELLIWCNERNLPVNGDSRSHYASFLLRQKREAEQKEK